jgi:alpha-methylacyl-CoA racemase
MGPLAGVKVVELSGIGPGPFCGMLLSDMGAEVIRVERREVVTGERRGIPEDIVGRGRRSIGVDLKHPEGVDCLLRLLDQADALIEGFRPGVMERLGLGPDVCFARNPRLVYGRMTGWGQEGPMAPRAGHDINYISLAGVLAHIGRAGAPPTPPINLVGDYGGGGMFLAFGIVCALLEANGSGQGQVVDAAMIDGAAALMAPVWGFAMHGLITDDRGTNLLDTGAHFYDVYETEDGEYVSVGAIETQFYAALLEGLGLAGEELPAQMDHSAWPAMKERFAAIFRTRTRDEWCEVFDGSDACFAPVLRMSEAGTDPHMASRSTFVQSGGVDQPGPAPRFSRTPGAIRNPPPPFGADTDATLADWGFSADEIAKLHEAGAIAQADG